MARNNEAGSGRSKPQLVLKETFFQTPNPVVPPNAMPKKADTPINSPASTNTSLRRGSRNELFAHETMVYEAVRPRIVTPKETKTLKRRLNTLCHSTWRFVKRAICPPASSELDDPESSTGQMLSSYQSFPVYGYGSISAGVIPTPVQGSIWTRAQERKLSPDGLTAQPTPQGNTIR